MTVNKRKERLLAKIIAFSVLGLIFISQAYLFFQVESIEDRQQGQYEELKSSLDSVNNDIQDVRSSYDQKLDRMGEYVVETREEYKSKTQDLLNQVEEVEKENDIQLKSLREDLKNLNRGDFTEVVDASMKAAVSVSTNSSQGSGAFITENGYLVTNHHVIRGYNQATVIDNTGKARTAEVIVTAERRDLAILKAEEEPRGHLPLGNSDDVLIGERVIAIGSPESLDFTVTQGIVSATERVFEEDEGSFIQTDVPINSGSSGGSLINTDGELIGINTFKLRDSESLGFAIPSNDVKNLLEKAKNVSGSSGQ